MLQVALPLGVFYPVDGRMAGAPAELCGVGLGEGLKFADTLVGDFYRGGHVFVVRTHHLAAVAAEAVAVERERGGELGGAVFDGVVRDASAAIESLVVECVVGTGLEAQRAAVASVGYRRVVVVEGRCGDQFCHVAVAAIGGVDEQGVLSYPSQSGLGSPQLVADGYGIDAGLGLEGGAALAYEGYQTEEHLSDAFVVVLAIGILGYAMGTLHGLRGLVAYEEADDGLGSFDQQPGVAPHLDVLFHKLHVALAPQAEPRSEPRFKALQLCGTGYAAAVKTYGSGYCLDLG